MNSLRRTWVKARWSSSQNGNTRVDARAPKRGDAKTKRRRDKWGEEGGGERQKVKRKTKNEKRKRKQKTISKPSKKNTQKDQKKKHAPPTLPNAVANKLWHVLSMHPHPESDVQPFVPPITPTDSGATQQQINAASTRCRQERAHIKPAQAVDAEISGATRPWLPKPWRGSRVPAS
jgi:hypothetical protein